MHAKDGRCTKGDRCPWKHDPDTLRRTWEWQNNSLQKSFFKTHPAGRSLSLLPTGKVGGGSAPTDDELRELATSSWSAADDDDVDADPFDDK